MTQHLFEPLETKTNEQGAMIRYSLCRVGQDLHAADAILQPGIHPDVVDSLPRIIRRERVARVVGMELGPGVDPILGANLFYSG